MKHLSVLFMFFLSQSLFAQAVTLRDTTNQFDYIIITIPEFIPACETYRQHKQSRFGFKILITDTAMIYDEFNAYLQKEDNIREFISYAGTFWHYPQPKYFLLAGNLNSVPNYMRILFAGTQYVDTAYSDHNYSCSVFGTSNDSCVFAIGRIPATNQIQLNNYFNKVIDYENDSSFSPWMTKNLFYEEYDSTINLYEQTANYLISSLPNNLTYKFLTDNINSPHYGNKDSLLSYINEEGILTLWLIGGSNDLQFGSSPIFTLQDLDLIVNTNKSFFTTFYARQSFAKNLTQTSLADNLLLDEDGSIGVLAPVGLAYAFDQGELLRIFLQQLFDLGHYSTGESLIKAKNIYLGSNSINIKILNLWGDPSLRLKYNPLADNYDDVTDKPDYFTLYQNYPNPFNPSTKISFSLANSGNVQIKIYDVLGNMVGILTDEYYDSGFHSIEFNARTLSQDLSSGIYFYSIKAGNYFQTKKMLYLK